jgi:hypothetical protein
MRGQWRGIRWSSSCRRGTRRRGGAPGRGGRIRGGPEVAVDGESLAAEEAEGNRRLQVEWGVAGTCWQVKDHRGETTELGEVGAGPDGGPKWLASVANGERGIGLQRSESGRASMRWRRNGGGFCTGHTCGKLRPRPHGAALTDSDVTSAMSTVTMW